MPWHPIRRYSLIAIALLLTTFCVISWFVAGSLIAPANGTVGPPPVDLPIQSHAFPSESSSTLATWYIPNAKSSATIVLLHSLRADRRSMLGRARMFHKAGFAIVMIDFQAHGESPGEYITMGHLEKRDVRAAVDFAKQLNPDHQIGVVGRSMGGAAMLLACPLDVDAVVLESVYPTITDAVYNRVEMRVGLLKHLVAPALLGQIRPRLGFTTGDLCPIEYVDKAECPLLVASGEFDKHTPLDETKRLFANASEPKTLVVFDGAAHEDLLKYDEEKYRKEILGFLTTHLLSKEQAGTGAPTTDKADQVTNDLL